MHKPVETNYKERFGIKDEDLQKNVPKVCEPGKSYRAKQNNRKGYFCAACKTDISKKVAIFCFNWSDRFGGKAYCMDCQKQFSVK